MKIGVSVPNIGPVATPEAVKTVAQRAEALGYNSLWTVERLLWPVQPKLPYPVTPDGSLPEEYKYTLDPLDTLMFAAAHTSRIKLGTSVLDIPYYNPILLARRLSTIDILSKGRLYVGLGLGWSPDEMEATGADMKVRGSRADEFLQVLKTIWTTDPAEYHGKFFSLPKSYINAKPVQKPHPPIFIAGVRSAGVKAGGNHGRWVEPDWPPGGSDGADVWSNTADG
jgi:probable F420-dependent oxidoreductase